MVEKTDVRKKSPRAPTIALDEALDRALRIYDKDRLHAIPTEIAAKHMGYQNANNGAALQCLASLRYYGLLERPRDGLVAVSKDVEAFKFSPDESMRKAFLRRFLATPPLFAELLDRAQAGGMPSDDSLRFDLIQRGFIPGSATTTATAFKRSVDFADALSSDSVGRSDSPHASNPMVGAPASQVGDNDFPAVASAKPQGSETPRIFEPSPVGELECDRIPVRLSGGRRAWIVIPAMFYDRDKARLKAQIDLLLTQDEEDEA